MKKFISVFILTVLISFTAIADTIVVVIPDGTMKYASGKHYETYYYKGFKYGGISNTATGYPGYYYLMEGGVLLIIDNSGKHHLFNCEWYTKPDEADGK